MKLSELEQGQIVVTKINLPFPGKTNMVLTDVECMILGPCQEEGEENYVEVVVISECIREFEEILLFKDLKLEIIEGIGIQHQQKNKYS